MRRHLLVIGAQRSGTTYLHSVLDGHPQITMARPARPEPKVFLSEAVVGRGAQWYRRTFFAHATDEAVWGEKSTSYLEVPEAAARVARVLGPRVHVVVVLRDPVQRAVSNWRFSTDHGLETRPLERALRENLAASASWDRAATSVSPFAYLERGRYADYLGPWFAQFPDTTHVLFLADLVGHDAALDDLFRHLGVRTGSRPVDRETVVNQSREPAPPLPGDLVAGLREYYAASDHALAVRLGRRPPWPTVPSESVR